MKLFKKDKPDTVKLPPSLGWRGMYEGRGSLRLAASISAELARMVTLELSGKIYGSGAGGFYKQRVF